MLTYSKCQTAKASRSGFTSLADGVLQELDSTPVMTSFKFILYDLVAALCVQFSLIDVDLTGRLNSFIVCPERHLLCWKGG